MRRLTLALLTSVSLTAFACGAEQREIRDEDARQDDQIELTLVSGECPSDWPGPWTACPEADWVQQVAERAGYRITGETGSALIAQGNGWGFYIWATEGTKPEIRRAAKREKWQPLGTVEGIEVYGDESLWRWWVVDGFVLWIQAGPYSNSRIPPLDEMASLVRASEAAPTPR